MDGSCSAHGSDEIVRKPEGKKPLENSKHRWEDNIRMNLTEGMGICGLDSSG